MNKLFPKKNKILIVGDTILDVYYSGIVDRVSPEAPVPVVQVNKTSKKLGGAANVANNISKLGGNALLIGFSGKDTNRKILLDLLDENDINHFLIETECPTITKIRIVSGVQQIVRVDFEENIISTKILEEFKRKQFDKHFQESEIIILSDYGKGFATEEFCQYIIEKANAAGIPVIIDPKGKSWEKYRNATIVTPNVKELSEVAGYPIKNEDEIIEKAALEVKKKYNLKSLLVTRSEKGMSFFGGDIEHIRTTATEVFDVSGAGDTVVATIARAISSGYSWIDSIKLANKAAGIVVSKIGTEPITYIELEDSIEEYREENKIIAGYDVLRGAIKKLKNKDKKIVFTNGCFDIIHKGHIKYLQEAKKHGDVLIIGLNSDDSVKRLKGQERPIKDQEERSLIMSALEMVDYVIVFNEDTPEAIIEKIAPDVLIKGGDYKIEEIIGREYAKETVVIPFINGYSTTSTINKIKTS